MPETIQLKFRASVGLVARTHLGLPLMVRQAGKNVASFVTRMRTVCVPKKLMSYPC
jgi:hypothetical protein